MKEFLPQLSERNFKQIPQSQDIANIWRRRGIADGKIDWRMSSQSIHNLVKGLAKPYVGAHFLLDGSEIKVWKTAVIADKYDNIEPGKVLEKLAHAIIVKCGQGSIVLLHTEPKLKIEPGSYL